MRQLISPLVSFASPSNRTLGRIAALAFAVALATGGWSPASQATTIYDEFSSSDLGGRSGPPTFTASPTVVLSPGSNSLRGRLLGGGDQDAITLVVAPGQELVGLFLAAWNTNVPDAFNAILWNDGLGGAAGGLIGFGTASTGKIGVDLLPEITAGPLGPGTYNFGVGTGTAVVTDYIFDFLVVPEPSTALLTAAGILGLMFRPRRSTRSMMRCIRASLSTQHAWGVAAFLTAVGVATAAAPTHGITMVSNLSETSTGGSGLTAGGGLLSATSFTTDGNSYLLESITLLLQGFGPDAIIVPVGLYADASSQPGSLIEGLPSISSPLPGFPGIALTTPSTGALLAPNTTYWVSPGPTLDPAAWTLADSPSESGPGSWTIGDRLLLSGDGGTTWMPFAATGQLSIQATAVPESAIHFLNTGALALLLGVARSGPAKPLPGRRSPTSPRPS